MPSKASHLEGDNTISGEMMALGSDIGSEELSREEIHEQICIQKFLLFLQKHPVIKEFLKIIFGKLLPDSAILTGSLAAIFHGANLKSNDADIMDQVWSWKYFRSVCIAWMHENKVSLHEHKTPEELLPKNFSDLPTTDTGDQAYKFPEISLKNAEYSINLDIHAQNPDDPASIIGMTTYHEFYLDGVLIRVSDVRSLLNLYLIKLSLATKKGEALKRIYTIRELIRNNPVLEFNLETLWKVRSITADPLVHDGILQLCDSFTYATEQDGVKSRFERMFEHFITVRFPENPKTSAS